MKEKKANEEEIEIRHLKIMRNHNQQSLTMDKENK